MALNIGFQQYANSLGNKIQTYSSRPRLLFFILFENKIITEHFICQHLFRKIFNPVPAIKMDRSRKMMPFLDKSKPGQYKRDLKIRTAEQLVQPAKKKESILSNSKNEKKKSQ